MDQNSEIDRIQQQIELRKQHLDELHKQKAIYGVIASLEILYDLDDTAKELERLQKQLDKLLGVVIPGVSRVTSDAPLCERLSENQWLILQQSATHAAIAGGMAAMGFYRGAWQPPTVLAEDQKNPSTLADVQATLRILQTIHPLLAPTARSFDCGLSYLGEETEYREQFETNLTGDILERIRSPEEFFAGKKHGFRVIFDGIDGTGSFIRGLPLFCSAVAILVDNQLRASAIYDPVHHVVYTALLAGPYQHPEQQPQAWAWQVATGNRLNLVELAQAADKHALKHEAIGFHLTRSKEARLHEFLAPHPRLHSSMLQRLALASGGMYALGSGIVAMADVARGALGGFVNIVTNLWDVAAGEALVRACGGKVTTFAGSPIEYTSPNQVSVIAAKGHLYEEIRGLLDKT